MTLLDRETMPPGGYTYFQADTNTRITSPTLRELGEAVIRHRQSNNIPTGNLDAVMLECENQLCATSPPGICRDVQGQLIANGVNLTLEDVKRGTATLVDWFLHGREKVDRNVATQRAKTCASCYANKDPVGCGSCSANVLREIADKIVGGDSTDYDGFLKACAICGCQTRAKIWLPLNLLRRHMPEDQVARFPAHCWLLTE